MDWDFAFKAIGAVGVAVAPFILGLLRIAYDFTYGRAGQRREEFKFAKDFFDSLSSNDTLHPHVIEKGYRTISGDAYSSVDHLEYIFSFKNSMSAFRDNISAREYVEYKSINGKSEIIFRGRLKNTWLRIFLMSSHMLFFIVSYIGAFSPLLLHVFWKFNIPISLIISYPFIFLPFAVLFSGRFQAMYRAQRLVRTQEQRVLKKSIIMLP